MNQVAVYQYDGGLADLLERFITLLCEYIVDEAPRNETIVYKLCEIYLKRNTDQTVNLVEVSIFRQISVNLSFKIV